MYRGANTRGDTRRALAEFELLGPVHVWEKQWTEVNHVRAFKWVRLDKAAVPIPPPEKEEEEEAVEEANDAAKEGEAKPAEDGTAKTEEPEGKQEEATGGETAATSAPEATAADTGPGAPSKEVQNASDGEMGKQEEEVEGDNRTSEAKSTTHQAETEPGDAKEVAGVGDAEDQEMKEEGQGSDRRSEDKPDVDASLRKSGKGEEDGHAMEIDGGLEKDTDGKRDEEEQHEVAERGGSGEKMDLQMGEPASKESATTGERREAEMDHGNAMDQSADATAPVDPQESEAVEANDGGEKALEDQEPEEEEKEEGGNDSAGEMDSMNDTEDAGQHTDPKATEGRKGGDAEEDEDADEQPAKELDDERR